MGQTKIGSKAPNDRQNNEDVYVAQIGVTGARPGVGARRRAPGGRVFAHGTRPGTARRSDMGPPSSGLTTRRRVQKGPVQWDLGGSHGRGPR